LLLKPITPMAVCTTMATRLVPLATAGGSPRKIRKGREIREAPPAIVFINPTTKPTATSIT